MTPTKMTDYQGTAYGTVQAAVEGKIHGEGLEFETKLDVLEKKLARATMVIGKLIDLLVSKNLLTDEEVSKLMEGIY